MSKRMVALAIAAVGVFSVVTVRSWSVATSWAVDDAHASTLRGGVTYCATEQETQFFCSEAEVEIGGIRMRCTGEDDLEPDEWCAYEYFWNGLMCFIQTYDCGGERFYYDPVWEVWYTEHTACGSVVERTDAREVEYANCEPFPEQ